MPWEFLRQPATWIRCLTSNHFKTFFVIFFFIENVKSEGVGTTKLFVRRNVEWIKNEMNSNKILSYFNNLSFVRVISHVNVQYESIFIEYSCFRYI